MRSPSLKQTARCIDLLPTKMRNLLLWPLETLSIIKMTWVVSSNNIMAMTLLWPYLPMVVPAAQLPSQLRLRTHSDNVLQSRLSVPTPTSRGAVGASLPWQCGISSQEWWK